jgi:hypothetical protein
MACGLVDVVVEERNSYDARGWKFHRTGGERAHLDGCIIEYTELSSPVIVSNKSSNASKFREREREREIKA